MDGENLAMVMGRIGGDWPLLARHLKCLSEAEVDAMRQQHPADSSTANTATVSTYSTGGLSLCYYGLFIHHVHVIESIIAKPALYFYCSHCIYTFWSISISSIVEISQNIISHAYLLFSKHLLNEYFYFI